MSDRNDRGVPPPRPLVQRLGAILWPSFFSAGVSTVVLFALVDPLDLAAISFPELQISRLGGYSMAFFVFWTAYAATCTFTWLLLRPSERFRRRPPDGGAEYRESARRRMTGAS
ncbi:MAG: hypothetical protein Kow0020_08590 [Wenzhouxiangellaceae bacterium]